MARARRASGFTAHLRTLSRDRTKEYCALAWLRRSDEASAGPDVLCLYQGPQIRSADGAGGLSPRTVHHMHRVLKQALAVAVKWSLLPRNPTDSVDPPKVERTTMRALDTSETAAFLGAHSSYAKLYLGVTCRSLRSPARRDCRPQWRAVDLPRGQIFVVESIEQTKTGT